MNSRSGQKFWRTYPMAAFDFAFFPAAARLQARGIEAVLAGKGEKARMETDQTAIVFGDGGGQIVIADFAGDAAQRGESMNVTTDEGFETLAVSELQIQHAAVRFDQGKGIELALSPEYSSAPKCPQSTSKRSPGEGSMRTKARLRLACGRTFCK